MRTSTRTPPSSSGPRRADATPVAVTRSRTGGQLVARGRAGPSPISTRYRRSSTGPAARRRPDAQQLHRGEQDRHPVGRIVTQLGTPSSPATRSTSTPTSSPQALDLAGQRLGQLGASGPRPPRSAPGGTHPHHRRPAPGEVGQQQLPAARRRSRVPRSHRPLARIRASASGDPPAGESVVGLEAGAIAGRSGPLRGSTASSSAPRRSRPLSRSTACTRCSDSDWFSLAWHATPVADQQAQAATGDHPMTITSTMATPWTLMEP